MAGDRGETGPLSRRLRLLNLLLRHVAQPRLRATARPAEARREFDRFARYFFRRPPHLLRLVSRGHPDIHWITAGPVHPRRVLLYFHGGGYFAGSPRSHAGMIGRLSALSGLRVAAPAYRLAPEHTAPAQFDDAKAAHAALLDLGYLPGDICLGGDSAGGGLALALLADLCARELRPACAFAFSPWVDLTLSGDSMQANAALDPILPRLRMAETVASILGKCDARDPRLSPLFASFPAPPPVRLHVGATEILRDDSRQMAAHLRAAGGEVSLREWPGVPHLWPIFDGYIPEARAALEDVATFLKLYTGAP